MRVSNVRRWRTMRQQPQTLQLPQGVKLEFGRYYLIKKVLGKTRRIPLTREEEGLEALKTEYANHVDSVRTVEELLRFYIRHGMGDLSPVTRHGYIGHIHAKLIPTFGKMLVENVQKCHIAAFLETQKKLGSGTSANRARAVLSSAYECGLRHQKVNANPCRDIRRNLEVPSEAYVEDEAMVETILKVPDALALILDVAYITGLRQIDLITLQRRQVTEKGLVVNESKTGKHRLILWTDALRTVIKAAIENGDAHMARRSHRDKKQYAAPEHVFINQRGQPYTANAIAQAMKRNKASFTFRQLRPKAASDADHNVLGHSGQMLSVYNRREKLRPVF
jgi:integrase